MISIKAFFYPEFIGDKKDGNTPVFDTISKHKDKKITLKFDIEGAEYIESVWDSLSNLPENIIAVTCELHSVPQNLNKINIWIKNSGFKLVHLHANNNNGVGSFFIPNLIEITLVRPDFFTPSGFEMSYPLDMDSPCVTYAPEINPIWFLESRNKVN